MPSSLKQVEGDSRLKAIQSPGGGGLMLWMFGQEDPQNPLSKLEVRQALSLAFDRAAIAKGVYQGYARPTAVSLWNPAVPGFPAWGLESPPYDLEKAKQLLVKAGYPDGKGIRITLHNSDYGPTPGWPQVASVLASQWGKLGIEVKLRQWEWGAYVSVAQAGKFEEPVNVTTHSCCGPNMWGNARFVRPDTGSYRIAAGTGRGAHKQWGEWAIQFDQELDGAKRAQLTQKILEYDRDNVVVMPVLLQDSLWVVGTRVLQYTPPPTGYAGNAWTIKVKP